MCLKPTRFLATLGVDVPLANSFDVGAARYPLRVEVCDDCRLPQLEETVEPKRMFSDYPYHSSMSQTFVTAAKELVDKQVVKADDLVVEIGSNDGYLLQWYPDDVRVLGVDPSNVASCVPTVRGYFDERLAWSLVGKHGHAKVIHANNVIAHCPDPHTIFAGLAALVAVDGHIIIESPYVEGFVDGWDCIYHEHAFYWSATAVKKVAAKHGLTLQHVEKIPMHGGSVRYWIAEGGHGDLTVQSMLAAEETLSFDALPERIRSDVAALRSLDFGDKTVCGYGAAAKGSILRHVANLDLAFVCDTTPAKQGKTMPGTTIPIVEPGFLHQADVAILFAWNFADEIMERESGFAGEWILPHRVRELVSA